MVRRKMRNRKKDRTVFSKTSRNKKIINYSTMSTRGGTRL